MEVPFLSYEEENQVLLWAVECEIECIEADIRINTDAEIQDNFSDPCPGYIPCPVSELSW